MVVEQVFILSPARCEGKRVDLLLRDKAQFELAVRIRECGAPIGEVFSFLSGLYFRGKLNYARKFSDPRASVPGVWVITAGKGLVPSGEIVHSHDLRAFASVPIDLNEPRYVNPIKRDATALSKALGPDGRAVLLGSLATDKYVGVLQSTWRERLVFPREFVGRGDMSRGGLLLRCCDENRELEYIPIAGAILHGRRPGKLSKRNTTRPSSDRGSE